MKIEIKLSKNEENSPKLAQVEVHRMWQESGKRFIECPICEKGQYGGIFWHCCSNPQCYLYNSDIMASCRMCGSARRECVC